jgi:hypothetical protein
MENALQKGVEVLDTNPEAGFSYGQAYVIDEEGRVFGLRKQRCKHSYVREGWEELKELVFGCRIPSPATMVRRHCLDEVGGFNPAFVSGSQDLELWVRLAKRYAVAYIAEPIAKYRVHSQTISASREPEEIERTHRLILESVFSDAQVGPLLASQRATAYFNLNLGTATSAYYNRRQPSTARHYLLKAVRAHPTGLLGSFGLQWVRLFAKTLIPWPVLTLASRYKRQLKRTMFFQTVTSIKS